MKVYHGTDSLSAENIVKNGIDLKYGDESVDNARGFYMTPNCIFAVQRAKTATERKKRFSSEENDACPAVLVIDFVLPESGILSVKDFSGCSYEWQEFVLYNRLGTRFLRKRKIHSDNHNLDFKYDVVMDETADSQIGNTVSEIRYGDPRSSIEDAIKKVAVSDRPNWDRQISVHSERAVELCIRAMHIQYV